MIEAMKEQHNDLELEQFRSEVIEESIWKSKWMNSGKKLKYY